MKPITIFNVRRGFANNSSSSHSMILMDPSNPVAEVDAHGNFGWNDFTLIQPDDKKNYLTSLLGQALAQDVGQGIALQVLKDLNLLESDANEWNTPEIDHQSCVSLPQSSDQTVPNIEFVREFVAWAMRPEVAILGGNDNSDGHPDQDKGLAYADWRNWLSDDVVAWKDEANDTWSLFSKKNGLSLRLSFNDMAHTQTRFPYDDDVQEQKSNLAASRPNLVDLKITDRCPFNCAYCYQASTPKAPHGRLSDILEIVQSLSEQQVFEVAIGGGEPTIHPDFDQIIEEFHARGVTPNFTTRNTTWLKSERSDNVLERVGGFAISVDNIKGTSEALEALKISSARRRRHSDVSLQIVVGTQSKEEFQSMLRLIFQVDYPPKITLLGYKNNGFGAPYRLNPAKEAQINEANENWMQWVSDIHHEVEQERKEASKAANKYYSPKNLWVSVDTALAEISKTKLAQLPGGKTMFHTKEGAQSMYVDATTLMMAPSSFAHPDQSIAWDKDNWVKQFQAFTTTSTPSSKPKRR